MTDKMTVAEALDKLHNIMCGWTFHAGFPGDEGIAALSVLREALAERDALKAEVERPCPSCDQRDAALESVGLLTKEVERLKKPVKIPKRENRWRHWKARAEKAEAEALESLGRYIAGNELDYKAREALSVLREALAERDNLKGTKEEWFSKGRESVLRNNQSGCCCLFNEQDEIVSLCAAHKEREDSLKAEVERLNGVIKHLNNTNDAVALKWHRCSQHITRLNKAHLKWKARAEKAEADLAAARPLLEAAMTMDDKGFAATDELFGAALAYRAAKQTPAPPEEEEK